MFIVIECLSDPSFDYSANSTMLRNLFRLPNSDSSSLEHLMSTLATEFPDDRRDMYVVATIIHLLCFLIGDE